MPSFRRPILSGITAVFCVIVLPASASAADRYWVGSAGGNWNDTAHWSTAANTCGTSGGASVPGTADIARFVSNCVNDALANATVSVLGINIASGYSGVISQSPGVTVTVGTSHYVQAGGTFAATEDLTIAGNFTKTGGVFDEGTGIVTFVPGATRTIDVATSETFHAVRIAAVGDYSITIASGDTIVVNGTLTLNRGFLNTGTIAAHGVVLQEATFGYPGSSHIISGGSAIIDFANDAVAQTYTIEGGKGPRLRFDSAADANDSVVFQADGSFRSLIIQEGFGDNPVPLTYNGYALTLGDDGLSQASGTFTAPTTLTFYGGITKTGGTFAAGAGTVILRDAGYTIDVGDGQTLAFASLNVSVDTGGQIVIESGDVITVGATLTLTTGAVNTGTIRAEGNIVQKSTAGFASDLTAGGSAVIDFANDAVAQTYTIEGGKGPHLRFDSAADASDSVVFQANGGFRGLIIHSGFGDNPVPMTYNGYALTLGYSGYLQNAGAFTAPTLLTVNDAFEIGGGTFDPGTGTVRFRDSGYTIDVLSQQSFHHLTCEVTHAGTATIASGDRLIIAGTLTLTNGRMNTGILEAQGDVTIATGFDGGTARLLFSGSANQLYTDAGGNEPDGDVTIDKEDGTLTLASNADWNAAGQDLTVTNGTIDFNGQTIAVGGNLTMGPGAQIVADTDAMNGAAITVGGNLDLDGESGDKLTFRWTDAWSLNVTGNATFDFVSLATTGTTPMTLTVNGTTATARNTDVTYSDASGGTQIDATDATNTDNDFNLAWLFGEGGDANPVPFFPWWAIPIALLGGGWMLRREGAA